GVLPQLPKNVEPASPFPDVWKVEVRPPRSQCDDQWSTGPCRTPPAPPGRVARRRRLLRRATPGALRGTRGGGSVRGAGPPPRADGPGRLPPPAASHLRRRRRLSGDLPGPFPPGSLARPGRIARQLPVHRGLSCGTQGEGRQRPPAAEREGGAGHAPAPATARRTLDRPAAG